MRTRTRAAWGSCTLWLPLLACRPEAPVPSGFLDSEGTTSGGEPASTTAVAVDSSSTGEPGTAEGTGTTEPVIPDGTSSTDASDATDTSETSETTDTDETSETSSGTTDGTTGDEPQCGDGRIEGLEECDDAGESATCDADCTIADCGDGLANGSAAEECDGVDLGGASCATVGFDGGPLACSGACLYDTSGCTVCGNGLVEAGEACDGADLGGATCASLGFAGGPLACAAGCTDLDTSGCYICGNGVIDPGEQCDAAGNSATCDSDCTPAVCGDGVENPAAGEQCDTAGSSMTCDSDCTPPDCGDGVVNPVTGEQCDDANLIDDDACSNACTANICPFPVGVLPVTVHPSNFYGEIDFDGDCNLVVSGSFNPSVYRVSPAGVVSVLAGIGASSINGIAYRASDDLTYVATDSPSQLWAVSAAGVANLVMGLPTTINAIEVAPAAFGPYGDRILGVGIDGMVYAFDPAAGSTVVVGSNASNLSSLVFDPSGSSLYVTAYDQGVVLEMDAAGVFSAVAGGFVGPDGLAISPEGTLFVADSSVPSITAFELATGLQGVIGNPSLDGGYYVTGLLYEGGGNLLMKVQGANIDYLTPP